MPTYAEFEALKDYQYSHELLSDKFARRVAENFFETRNPETQNRFLPAGRFLGYFCAAAVTQFVVLLEIPLREGLGYGCRRAHVANDLYDDYIFITRELDSPTINQKLIIERIKNISNIMNDNVLNPSLKYGESKILKPMAIQAFLKIITLLLENHNEIFKSSELKSAIAPILSSFSQDDIVDERIRALVRPTYSLQQFYENPSLKPNTINQIALKLASIPVVDVESFCTQEKITTAIDEFLTETQALPNILNDTFIEQLLQSEVLDGRNVFLKAYLPTNSEDAAKEFIREAIRKLPSKQSVPEKSTIAQANLEGEASGLFRSPSSTHLTEKSTRVVVTTSIKP
jgi:hypothetical protein